MFYISKYYRSAIIVINNIIDRVEKYSNKNIALWIIGNYYISVMFFAPSQITIAGLNLSLFDYFTFIWGVFLYLLRII